MKKLFVLALVLLTVLASDSCKRRDSQKDQGPSPRASAQAPDFVLKDIRGNEVSLSALRGKVVLVEFWATWCPPCRASVPELIAMQEKYRDRGFVILAVSLDEGGEIVSKLSAFSEELKVNYTVLLGTEDVARSYNVLSIPMSFIIDKEGRIANSYMGYVEDFETNVGSQIEKLI